LNKNLIESKPIAHMGNAMHTTYHSKLTKSGLLQMDEDQIEPNKIFSKKFQVVATLKTGKRE